LGEGLEEREKGKIIRENLHDRPAKLCEMRAV